MKQPCSPLVLACTAAMGAALLAGEAQPGFFPIEEVRPGMVGIGRTVFSGSTLEEFRANIVGVLRNVIGPGRNLVLAKLEGGPLASTGVIQGMSGSPVYIEGRLLGAVSYALGSFPKEPFAGITPIAEMTEAVTAPAPLNRRGGEPIALWPTTIEGVAARLGEIARRASPPIGIPLPGFSVVGPASLSELAPTLRPIGAAMVVSGLDSAVRADLERSFPGSVRSVQRPDAAGSGAPPVLQPGEPVGMSLIRGDFELGATGTVTYVDGPRVYAFGHPFLNLGPTSMAMTRAHVYAVLPSLDSSMKIAGLGPVIGTMNQDRATAVGGTLGSAPPELDITITLESDRAPSHRLSLSVLHDESLTPLFAYVAVYNALLGYERSAGALSIAARGSIDYGPHGRLEIDDTFAGPAAVAETAAMTTASIGPAASNAFASVLPSSLDLTLRVTETVERLTIERAWLDTTKPRAGATHTLHVLLREYRGRTRTIQVPVTMPLSADGPLTLAVIDAAGLTALEARDLRPAQPASLAQLFARLGERRENNRIYVRLLSSTTGTSVGGATLPALPTSVRSVLESDPTIKSAPVARTVVGAWDQRLDNAVAGSHELTIRLSSSR